MKRGAQEFARVIRSHWEIENSLHGLLDLAFRKDESRIRKSHAAENLSLIRRLALTRLKSESTLQTGIKDKRLRAAWDEIYLWKVLGG